MLDVEISNKPIPVRKIPPVEDREARKKLKTFFLE
jgi:hypothetical protein